MSTKDYQRRDQNNIQHGLWLRFVKLLNVLLEAIPFGICWYFFYAGRIVSPYYNKGNWVIVGLFVLLYTILCRLYGGFVISLARISELVYSQILAVAISDFFMYCITLLLAKRLLAVWPILCALFVQAVVSVVWSFAAHWLYFGIHKPLRTIVVWDMYEGLNDLVNSYGLDKRFNIIATPHVRAFLKRPEHHTAHIEAVFLCGIHSHDRNQIAKYCMRSGIRVYVVPNIGDVILSGAKSIHMFHLPMMMLERYNPSPEYLFIKRAFDIVASGLGLILLSPIMAVIAVLIRGDGGTAFYRQKRLTRNGKEFYVLKFRSMRMDAEKDGVARLSTGENDDRITPIGRFIRACRIDELPQLINILKGEMSIVGPRPERPEIAAEYEKELPEFALRLQAKAGLTGYAQVYGKYNTSPRDKLLMDLRYISHPSFVEDLKIMFATVKVLFMAESTEGFSASRMTAAKDSVYRGENDLIAK